MYHKIFEGRTAIDLFEFMCAHDFRPFTSMELHKETGISRPTLTQILKTFEKYKIVMRDEKKRYWYARSEFARFLQRSVAIISYYTDDRSIDEKIELDDLFDEVA